MASSLALYERERDLFSCSGGEGSTKEMADVVEKRGGGMAAPSQRKRKRMKKKRGRKVDAIGGEKEKILIP